MKADIRTENMAIEVRSGRVSLQTEFSAFRGSPRRRSSRIPEDENASLAILDNQGEFNGQLRF